MRWTPALAAALSGTGPACQHDTQAPLQSVCSVLNVDQVVLAITLDREEIPVGILEPGDFAAASAG